MQNKIPEEIHKDLHINSYGHYLRRKFGTRVSKVNVDAGFTCPNRDGSRGVGGCLYCNNVSFSPKETKAEIDMDSQILSGMEYHKKRLHSEKFIIYFQKYTNTYAPLKHLEELYIKALSYPDVIGLSVGTRPDSISIEILNLLQEIAKTKYLCLEIGLQSADDQILSSINRGHTVDEFFKAVDMAAGRGFDICVHLIHGFAGETKESFLKTAQMVGGMEQITSLKLHQLHAVEGTELAAIYRRGEFTPISFNNYLNDVADFLELLPSRISIQRLYGSAPLDICIAPRWGLKNNQMWYAIINELSRRNSWQGKFS